MNQQLTIEATKLSDRLWLAQLDVGRSLGQETNKAKLTSLIARWLRLDILNKKALKRMARRLGKQVDV